VTEQISVGVLATLDSKHAAARFVCDALAELGVTPWLVDLSLRPHTQSFADVGGADVAAVMAADPLVNERLNLTGQLPNPGGPAEFGAAIDAQRAGLAVIAKDLGLKATQ